MRFLNNAFVGILNPPTVPKALDFGLWALDRVVIYCVQILIMRGRFRYANELAVRKGAPQL